MSHPNYTTLRLSREAGVARVTIDNPPVNVLDLALMTQLRDLLAALRDDESVRVIVFDSADPEFFIAQVDMTIGDEMDALQKLATGDPEGTNVFQALAPDAISTGLVREHDVWATRIAAHQRLGS